jgi:hypothetical protein
MKRFALGLCLASFLARSLSAQERALFSFQISGGFTQPVGDTGRHLAEGWNVQGGGGVNFGPYVGVMIDLGYNSFGINSVTLNYLGFPAGDLHIFSATLDPIVHLNPHGHVDAYITGGGGIYRRLQEFTQPSLASVSRFDPFFGFFQAAVPVNQVVASYSVNKPGVDIGAGLAFGTKWHGKFFAEARYDRIFLGNDRHTDYVPVSVGFRW